MKNPFYIAIPTQRKFGLDLLRALAIMFVVVGHSTALLPAKIAGVINYFVLDGVSIFFVLSGFLIGSILIRDFENKEISFKHLIHFWKRRWFRTLPNYFFILAILIILDSIFKNRIGLNELSRFLTFSQNLFTPHPYFFPEAWSLSVEEWFYLLIPFIIFVIIFVFKKRVRVALLVTAVSIIVLITLFRSYRYFILSINSISDFSEIYRKEVLTRLDSIMFGVIGAYLFYYYKNIWGKFKVPVFLTGICLLIVPSLIKNYSSQYLLIWSFTINSIGTLLLLPFLNQVKINTDKGKLFRTSYKAVTYISLISYSMYLINYSLVLKWIIGNIDLVNYNHSIVAIAKFSLFWILTILLSILIYKYFEVPTTKLRNKKFNFGFERSKELLLSKDDLT